MCVPLWIMVLDPDLQAKLVYANVAQSSPQAELHHLHNYPTRHVLMVQRLSLRISSFNLYYIVLLKKINDPSTTS